MNLGVVWSQLTGATILARFWRWPAGTGVLVAAVAMSAGSLFSARGAGRTGPNRWIGLLFGGAAAPAGGVVALGFGLLPAG